MRTFNGLRKLVATLRGPGGCPWDRVQTHESLRPYLLEEACETLEALDEGDPAKLREELGDLLLEVLLQVQIAEEAGEFALADVVESISDKLVRRHPHVFAGATADTPQAVVEQWDDLKRVERGDRSALAGIPVSLPGLARAQATQRRAAGEGFNWESEEQVWAALDEELAELRAASGDEERRREAGDVLFAMAGLARWLDVDAEEALRSTVRRFGKRYERLEETARASGRPLAGMTSDEKLALWDALKEPAGRE